MIATESRDVEAGAAQADMVGSWSIAMTGSRSESW